MDQLCNRLTEHELSQDFDQYPYFHHTPCFKFVAVFNFS